MSHLPEDRKVPRRESVPVAGHEIRFLSTESLVEHLRPIRGLTLEFHPSLLWPDPLEVLSQSREISDGFSHRNWWSNTRGLRDSLSPDHPGIFWNRGPLGKGDVALVRSRRSLGNSSDAQIGPDPHEEDSPTLLGNSVPRGVEEEIPYVVAEVCSFPGDSARNVDAEGLSHTWHVLHDEGFWLGCTDKCEEPPIQDIAVGIFEPALPGLLVSGQETGLLGPSDAREALAGRTADNDARDGGKAIENLSGVQYCEVTLSGAGEDFSFSIAEIRRERFAGRRVEFDCSDRPGTGSLETYGHATCPGEEIQDRVFSRHGIRCVVGRELAPRQL